MEMVQGFKNQEFGEIRTIIIEGEPWFIGKDVAEKLGFKRSADALATHIDAEDKRFVKVGEIPTLEIASKYGAYIINESGLYSLIFGSKLESAKRFKHWVTSEVLPELRKTGSYQKPLSAKQMMRIQLGMIDDHEERIEKLENTMTIDYGQQQVIGREVNKVVIEALGGKGTEAYRALGKKVFAECNKDIKEIFNVNSRCNIPRCKFEEALAYIKGWKPSTNTQIRIRVENDQQTVFV